MLVRAEEAFRAQMPPTVPVKWRSYIANTTAMLIEQARRCDILVAASGDVLEPGESLDAGQLILGSGRPVIMVGDHADAFSLGQVVIAWKDSREARRAVADAIPLLQRAKRIKAVTYSEGDGESEAASLSDLIAWLGRHGVHAEGLLVKESLEFFDAMEPLTKGAPDLIVAGGYGHSRFREWLLGGVTNDLLNARSVNRLFSN
jgi:nucleotide-binding universal stress UspA family protein